MSAYAKRSSALQLSVKYKFVRSNRFDRDKEWCHNTRYNDTGHNDTQHNDTQHNELNSEM